jgi:hypothetical protein
MPYLLPFTVERVPNWSCPVCRAGTLALVQNSLTNQETAASRREHDHDAWEPDWIRSVFACVFRCNNDKCLEPVACSGFGQVDRFSYEDEDGWEEVTEEQLTPHYFHPPLVMMDIPTKCPEKVASRLAESFALFFADAGAALNSVRSSVEALMTAMGVKRFNVVRNKQRPLSLHQRIQLLPPKYQEQKDMLLAVKWLGNAGSHNGDKPTVADVRTAYDLMEHVLSEIYEAKGKQLKALAKKVNKKKGPVK